MICVSFIISNKILNTSTYIKGCADEVCMYIYIYMYFDTPAAGLCRLKVWHFPHASMT